MEIDGKWSLIMGFYKRCPISRTMVQFKPRLIVFVILCLWVGNSVLCYKQMQCDVLLPAAAWGGAMTGMAPCEMITNGKPGLGPSAPGWLPGHSWAGGGAAWTALHGAATPNLPYFSSGQSHLHRIMVSQRCAEMPVLVLFPCSCLNPWSIPLSHVKPCKSGVWGWEGGAALPQGLEGCDKRAQTWTAVLAYSCPYL